MRDERKVEGCLLSEENSKLVSTKSDVLLCGFCTNRSDMVGNLGIACLMKEVKHA